MSTLPLGLRTVDTAPGTAPGNTIGEGNTSCGGQGSLRVRGGGGDAGNGSVRCVETWEDRKAFPAAVSHRGPVRTELSWIFYGRFLQRSYSHGDDSAHASGKRGLRVPCPTLCVGLALQETHRIWLEKGRVFKPGRRTRARTHSIVFASVPENAPGALTTAFHRFWWSLNTDFMKIPCFNASW